MEIHTIYGVTLGTEVPLLGGIKQQGSQTGTTVNAETSSGSVAPQAIYVTKQDPVIPFATRSIAAALNVLGLYGANIKDLAAASAGTLVIYAQKVKHGGTRTPGAAHRRIVASDGMVIPKSLTIDHQGDATLTIESIVTWDGNNDPLIVTESVALPGSLTDSEAFSLGKVELAGFASTVIAQLTNLTIDFGNEAGVEGADSDIWPKLVWIKTGKPVITLKGNKLTWLGDSVVPLTGKPFTHANTKLYLRKRESGSADSFVADGTAEHISFTADGLAHIETPWDGSGDGPNEITMQMNCRDDGTNDPLVIDTATAIT